MGTRRDSTTLSEYEKALIKADFRAFKSRGFSEQGAVEMTAELHGVSEAEVREVVA